MKNNAKHFMSYALQMLCMKYGVTSIVIVIFFYGPLILLCGAY